MALFLQTNAASAISFPSSSFIMRPTEENLRFFYPEKDTDTQKLKDLNVPEKALQAILKILRETTDQELVWKIVNNYPWSNQSTALNNPEAIDATLEAHAYLFGSSCEQISNILKLNASLPRKNHKIIIVTGSYERERDLATQGIARATGRKTYTINCDQNDLESTFSTGFAGTASIFAGECKPGEILKALCTTGVSNPAIIIKKFEALPKNEIQNLFKAISPEATGPLHDNFMQFGLNTSEISFIVDIENYRGLPEHLAMLEDRIECINLGPQTRDQKIEITYRHLLPQILKSYELPKETLISLMRYIPAIVDLSTNNDSGLSQAMSALSKVITYCAIQSLQSSNPFILMDKDLERLIPPLPESNSVKVPTQVARIMQQKLSDVHINGAAYMAAIQAFPWEKTRIPAINRETALHTLNANHLFLNSQKQHLFRTIVALEATPRIHKKGICIVGAPGTGKTTLAEAAAEALGRPEYIINLAVNQPLNGDSMRIHTSEPGEFFKAFCSTKTQAPVIILDSIDKVHPLNVATILTALNPKTNENFADQFTGVDIDLSNAFFVATAIDASLIPAKLLDHLDLVYLDGYTPGEKLAIAKNHLLPNALAGRAMLEYEREEIKAIIPTLVERIAPNEKGLTSLNRAIQSLVSQQMASAVCTGQTLLLTPDNVMSFVDQLLTTHHLTESENIQAQCNEIIKKLNLTPDQFKHIDSHITALKPWRGGNALTLLYMDWVAKFPFNTTTNEVPSLAHALEQLNSTHFGLGSIKESIIDFLAGMHFNARTDEQKITKSLCFVGGPGIGKTTFAESIAAALGRPFARIALESIQSLKGGAGEHEMFGDGPGPIGRAMCTTGSLNPVILLDEIDKANPKVICQLLEILDPAQNKTFRDSFLGFDLDLSQVIFVASANDRSKIPSPLYDRLHAIDMEPYCQQERIDIAHNMIIPKIVRSMGFDDVIAEKLHNLARPMVEKIMGTEYGVRNLKRFLQTAADKYARMILENKPIKPLSVSDILGDLHAELLQSNPADEPATQPVIGISNGMYAHGNDGGGIMKIEASVIPYGKGELIKTLLHGKMSQESHSRTLAHVKSLCLNYNINPEVFSNSDFLFSDQTYHNVDGPSAGIAQAVALISALTKRAVKPGYAMTGAMDAYGHLLPVGGYRAKILGTERAGIKHILLPECSRDTIEKIRKDFPEITITYIKTLDEAVQILLEQ